MATRCCLICGSLMLRWSRDSSRRRFIDDGNMSNASHTLHRCHGDLEALHVYISSTATTRLSLHSRFIDFAMIWLIFTSTHRRWWHHVCGLTRIHQYRSDLNVLHVDTSSTAGTCLPPHMLFICVAVVLKFFTSTSRRRRHHVLLPHMQHINVAIFFMSTHRRQQHLPPHTRFISIW